MALSVKRPQCAPVLVRADREPAKPVGAGCIPDRAKAHIWRSDGATWFDPKDVAPEFAAGVATQQISHVCCSARKFSPLCQRAADRVARVVGCGLKSRNVYAGGGDRCSRPWRLSRV